MVSNINRATAFAPVLFLIVALFVAAGPWPSQKAAAQSEQPLVPGRLAIYYGFPSSVNGANGNIDAAVATFGAYDVVVFGDTLQLPQYDPADPGKNNPFYDKACTQNSHFDHDNTVAIIQHLVQQGVAVYGYVSIGGENTARICPTISSLPHPLTSGEIEHFVDLWKAMGVTGVFYDESGYDFGTDRARQNAAVDYAHSQGLSVFINAYLQEEIFEPAVVGHIVYVGNLAGQTSTIAMNPGGAATHLGATDLSLLEGFQVIQGEYVDPISWADRADKALRYQRQYDTRFATVTTALDDAPDCGFSQAKLDYAWWSTLLYGFEYMGWGEGFNFSAAGNCNAQLPLRARPAPADLGPALTSPQVEHALTVHSRQTTGGRVEVDTASHYGQYVAGTPGPSSGQPVAPNVGLIHWWPADNSAQDIVGAAHGALSVGKSWYAAGKAGQAFSLDGRDDFIAAGSTASITGNGSFSVDAWIRTLDDRGVIIQQRGSGYDGQYVLSVGGLWSTAPGSICWSTYGNGQFGFDFCSTMAVNDGGWHHVAGVREPDGTGKIYIDGTLNASQTAPARTLVPLEVYIGADRRNNLAYFSGLIDEVAISNRALSAEETLALAQAGSGGRTRPAAHGAWVFSDEITAVAARDALVQRSAASNVSDLYVSVYRSVANSAGRHMAADADLADLISKAHAAGIHVWAAYGAPDWPALGCAAAAFPMQRMREVIAYNSANPTAHFDGVILDVEPGEPQIESSYRSLLNLYACTLDTLKPAGLGLQVAVRFFWDAAVEYPAASKVTQRVYEHIVDMETHGIVVMGYRDFAGAADCATDGIVCLDKEEVAYASSQDRRNLIIAGLETENCAPGCGPEKVTFYEEGLAEMNRQAGCVLEAFASEASFGGFAIHRYGASYLSELPNWGTVNPTFPTSCNASVDWTPPVVTPIIDGTLGTNGWYVSDVVVTWSVVDGESAISNTSGCEPATINTDAAAITLLCSATSAGGTATESVSIKRDATAPAILGSTAPAPNGAGWYNNDVTVTFACADATSGIVSCGPGQVLSADGAGQSVTGMAIDQAGNLASASVANINIDRTPPAIHAIATPAANLAGWHNSDVSVAFACSDDGGSGVAACSPGVVVGTEGAAQSISGAAVDVAGNSATTSISLDIDKTPPAVVATIVPEANAAGWHNQDVTVSFSGSDTLSGIESCSAPVVLSSEGAGLSATGTCTDAAGNVSAAAAVGDVAIDKTPPETQITGQPADPSNTGDAAFSFAGSDAGSGVSGLECSLDGDAFLSCDSGAITYSQLGNGSHLFAVRAVDRAGNVDASPAQAQWTITLPAPLIQSQVAGVTGANGWYAGDVAVSWVVDGGGLAVESSGCEPQTVTSDTAGVTFTCTASSQGGSAAASVTIMRDATAPTILGTVTPAANGAGWHNADVLVSFTCADALAGIATCGPDQTMSSEGADQSATGSAVDQAGNNATVGVTGIHIDKTAPVAAASAAPPANGAGWNNSNVLVSFTGSDTLSGIADCSPAVLLTAEGAGVSASGACSDLAGNVSAPATAAAINIDMTGPVVNVTGVANGATYVLGSVPVAACTTQDALAGVAIPAVLTITGGDAWGQGQFTAACSGALDLAGNPGEATVTYWVGYSFSGFFQPVDNPPVVNSVKAGQAIPVKFSLGGDHGLDIFAQGFPASQQVACADGAPMSDLIETSSANASALQYNPTSGQYAYIWKSEKAWAGQCRVLVVRLKDGAEHSAIFKFK